MKLARVWITLATSVSFLKVFSSGYSAVNLTQCQFVSDITEFEESLRVTSWCLRVTSWSLGVTVIDLALNWQLFSNVGRPQSFVNVMSMNSTLDPVSTVRMLL